MAESEAEVRAQAEAAAAPRSSINVLDRVLGFLSSVRLGIWLMVVLIFFSILGTIIVQYNIDGFDKYYASLTPAQRQLYHTLGLFDLYHTWWFTALLILFSLNLVLVSIDLFPKAWRYVAEPVVRATPAFLKSQGVYKQFRLPDNQDITERLSQIVRRLGYRVRVTDDGLSTTVFGQKGVWNRFLVFIVHIAVLLILGAAFVGSRWGYEGIMPLAPGETANSIRISGAPVLGIPERHQPLPFQVVCNNIRIDLRDPDGPLEQGNFANWYTDVTFVKGDQRVVRTVYLNHPVDYEGYRFFQASFGPPGGASDVTLEISTPDGRRQTVRLERNKPVGVDGLGQVTFTGFRANVLNDQAQDYSQPAAELEIVKPNGERVRTAAFLTETVELMKNQSQMAGMIERLNVDGYSFRLQEFTRAPSFHVLQVQYDPGVDYTYLGYILLCSTLIAVFLFSHERVWAVIEQGKDQGSYLHLGGHTNRNQVSFERKFAKLVDQVLALGVEEVPSKPARAEVAVGDALT